MDQCVVPFNLPSNFAVIGSTGTGKTEFVKRLLINHKVMFDKPVHKIIYVYSIWQDSYIELQKALGDLVDFRTDIPDRDELIGLWNESKSETVLVLDDQANSMLSENTARAILDLVSVVSHHAHVSLVYILQAIYHGGKIMREVALNTHNYVLFKSSRNTRQISTLASQISPVEQKCIVDAFRKSTSKNFGYLVLDLSPNCNKDYQYRTNIFPGELTTVYK